MGIFILKPLVLRKLSLFKNENDALMHREGLKGVTVWRKIYISMAQPKMTVSCSFALPDYQTTWTARNDL